MNAHIEFFVETKYSHNYYVKRHTHDCYELILYIEGKGKTSISSKKYEFKENDFAIIKPKSIHDESSDEGARVMFMGFTLDGAEIEEGVYSYDKDDTTKKIMYLIKEENENKKPYYKQKMDLLTTELVIHLLRYPINYSKEKTTFDGVINYVKMNANKQITIREIANNLGYSYDYFRQMFIEKYHLSAKDFIIQTRLDTVKQYLTNNPDYNVDKIARITGFSSSSHLCSVFKKQFKMSPKEYRELELKKNIHLNIKDENIKDNINTYPGNRLKAITFSFDDNTQFDIKLAKLFEKYGLKCTFNINSGISNHDSKWVYKGVDIHRLTKEEMQKCYLGHEVASHTLTHPHLFELDSEGINREIKEDIKNLTEWFPNQKIIGHAYPYGQVNDEIIEVLKKNGVLWARTAGSSKSFDIPKDLYRYTPTCHFLDENINQIVDNFINSEPTKKQVLCIWGHSNELETNHCWANFEQLLKKLSNRLDVYYCTNSEALL